MSFIKRDLSLTSEEIRKRHYDLHLLLGFGVGLIVGSLKAPWPITLVLSGLFALAVGFVLEGYQAVYKKAETDPADYRFTGYGGLLAAPIGILFLFIQPSGWWLFFSGTLVIFYSWYMRKKRQNKGG